MTTTQSPSLPRYLELVRRRGTSSAPCEATTSSNRDLVAEPLRVTVREESEECEESPRPTDPRPDIGADAARWTVLLRSAWLEDDAAALGALHGVRCCGAVLEIQASGALRIVAGAGYSGTWGDDRQRWLAPHREAIGRWLRVMADGEREAA